MLTAPTLFASAIGKPAPPGAHRCFYCGATCGDEFTSAKFVADSFTERDCVSFPGSDYVCGGCVHCLRSDLGSVPLIDGTAQRPKEGGKRKPREGAEGTMQVRWFSWLLTPTSALAATPAHRQQLLAACLAPPEPPFAICLADGNKHQLFRTPVNLLAGRVALNCEGVRVDYHPDELASRLAIVARFVAVIGKGATTLRRLADPLHDGGVALQLGREYGYEVVQEMMLEWADVRRQPLTKLAIWLTPGKDDCRGSLDDSAA